MPCRIYYDTPESPSSRRAWIEICNFVMTSLFIVIFTDQWLNSKNHIPAITGVICSVICLLLFGPDRFIIPAMLFILTILTLLRKPLEEHMERENQKGDDSHA